MEKVFTFVSFAAVSSIPQAKEISLDEQKATNLRHINKFGGKVVAEIEISQSRDIDLLEDACERSEGYKQLRDMIKARAFKVLICLNRSRLGRTLALIEAVVQLCRRSKILIYETESPPPSLEFNGDTYDDLLIGAIKSAGAQREIAELRRRSEMGMLGKFKKGEFLNKIPYGWEAEYSPSGQRSIKLNEDAAHNIRLILIEYGLGQGLSYRATARELNNLGRTSPSGIPWTHAAVEHVWSYIYRYAGYSEINIFSKTNRPYARAQGNWPKIITEVEMHLLLEELKIRKESRQPFRRYRYSLIIWCVKCNHYMRMQSVRTTNKNKKGEITSTFHHDIAACRSGTRHKAAHIIHTKITRALTDFIITLQNRQNWGKYIADASRDISLVNKKIGAAILEMERLKEQMLQADDYLLDGTLDSERHARQVKRVKDKIEQLQHEVTELEDKRAMLENINHREDRLADLAENGMKYLTMEDERAANTRLRQLIRVWVADGKVTEVEIL